MKKVIQHSLIMSTIFSLLVMSVGLLTSTFTQVDAQTAGTSGQPGAATSPTSEASEPTAEAQETVSQLENSNAFSIINTTASISDNYAALLSQADENKTQANKLAFDKLAEIGIINPFEHNIFNDVLPMVSDWVTGIKPPFQIPGIATLGGGLFEGAEQPVFSPEAQEASSNIKQALEPILSNATSSLGAKALSQIIIQSTTPGQQSVPINLLGSDLVIKPEAMAESSESIIGAAATGAGIGAGFGPVGAVVGGVLGAGIGAFADWF